MGKFLEICPLSVHRTKRARRRMMKHAFWRTRAAMRIAHLVLKLKNSQVRKRQSKFKLQMSNGCPLLCLFIARICCVFWRFSTDFPILNFGRQEEAVGLSIKRSYIWDKIKVCHLTENLRIKRMDQDSRAFADFLLMVGEDRIEKDDQKTKDWCREFCERILAKHKRQKFRAWSSSSS